MALISLISTHQSCNACRQVLCLVMYLVLCLGRRAADHASPVLGLASFVLGAWEGEHVGEEPRFQGSGSHTAERRNWATLLPTNRMANL